MATDQETLMALLEGLPAEALVGAGKKLRERCGPTVEVCAFSANVGPVQQDEEGYLAASAFAREDIAFFNFFDGSPAECDPVEGHASEMDVRRIRGKESVTFVTEHAIDLGNFLLNTPVDERARDSVMHAYRFLEKYLPGNGKHDPLWEPDFLHAVQGKGVSCSAIDLNKLFTLFLKAANNYVWVSGYEAAHAIVDKAGSLPEEVNLVETYRRGMQGMFGIIRGCDVIYSGVGNGKLVDITELYQHPQRTTITRLMESREHVSTYLGQKGSEGIEDIDVIRLQPGKLLMAANGAAQRALKKTGEYHLLHKVFSSADMLAHQPLDVITTEIGKAMESYLPQIVGGNPAFVVMRGK